MKVIPVLDLMGRAVVHGVGGRREDYRPIRSRLTTGATPVAVLQALLELHPFDTVYIADLDAIERRGDHDAVLEQLRRAAPEVTFWVDGGFATAAEAGAWLARGLGHAVLGSESLADAEIPSRLPADRIVLSLDFRGARFVGPPALAVQPALWPPRVIAMTLARVGSGAGPDLERLEAISSLAGDHRVYAAGGVRGRADLDELARRGIAGALVATALHDGRLTAADLT